MRHFVAPQPLRGCPHRLQPVLPTFGRLGVLAVSEAKWVQTTNFINSQVGKGPLDHDCSYSAATRGPPL